MRRKLCRLLLLRTVLKITHHSRKIAKVTRKDETLSRVFASVLSGNWAVNKDLTPFFEKRSELSVRQGCLVWGPRVMIPETHRTAMLEELHMGHIEIVKMKNLAQSDAWWPKLIRAMEI